MDEKILLEAIEKIIDKKIDPIYTRLDGLEQKVDGLDQKVDGLDQKIDSIQEDLHEVREAQNYLIGWVDNLSKAVHIK